MRTLLAFPLVLAAAVVPACTDDDQDDADIASDDGNDLGESHAINAEADLLIDDAPTAAGKAGAIMMAIDDGESALADFILDLSSDPVILDFADEMIFVHTQHMADTAELLLSLDLVPIENDTSIALAQEVDANLRLLDTAADVDFEYMRQQVVMHSEALVIVDVLVDITPIDELAAWFNETLPVIQAHHVEAMSILRGL